MRCTTEPWRTSCWGWRASRTGGQMQCGGRSAGGSTITVCRAPWRKWIARQEIKIDAKTTTTGQWQRIENQNSHWNKKQKEKRKWELTDTAICDWAIKLFSTHSYTKHKLTFPSIQNLLLSNIFQFNYKSSRIRPTVSRNPNTQWNF